MLVIAGAGISGVSFLYHFVEHKYTRKIILVGKIGIGQLKVSMYAFKEKLIELLSILEKTDSLEYTEKLCNSYSYCMVEDKGLVDYRTMKMKLLDDQF